MNELKIKPKYRVGQLVETSDLYKAFGVVMKIQAFCVWSTKDQCGTYDIDYYITNGNNPWLTVPEKDIKRAIEN